MNVEKYLPLGTVVMLKNGTKRGMIIGYCMTFSDSDKVYDYCGVLYPEGILKSNQMLFFNHSDIDKIYYMGLVDEEYKNFNQNLKNTVDMLK